MKSYQYRFRNGIRFEINPSPFDDALDATVFDEKRDELVDCELEFTGTMDELVELTCSTIGWVGDELQTMKADYEAKRVLEERVEGLARELRGTWIEKAVLRDEGSDLGEWVDAFLEGACEPEDGGFVSLLVGQVFTREELLGAFRILRG